MVQHIQTTLFDQIHTGELHDLTDLGLVFSVIAWSLTFLAHGLWVMGTLEPHGQTIGEKFRAFRAEKDPILFDFLRAGFSE